MCTPFDNKAIKKKFDISKFIKICLRSVVIVGKLTWHIMLSIDGYYEGIAGDLSWHHVDNEYHSFAFQNLQQADLILFGRKTYEHMEAYWNTEVALDDNPSIAKIMNEKPKLVISKTLTEANWKNTTLLGSDYQNSIEQYKNSNENIILLGSGDLALSLIKNDIIDEYQCIFNPVILGGGKRLSHSHSKELKLSLMHRFKSGNVLLQYK